MNKPKYDALPADLRAVLDANSGAVAARMAAVPWDERGPIVAAEAVKRGNIITVISEAEKARWVAQTNPVIETWVAGSKERGLDGAALLAQARALVAKHGAGVV
jgi:TRAP-type C4-dicarboxylate transport system substrate-binding protein